MSTKQQHGRAQVRRDCFAEPVIGPAKGRTRWLAMTGLLSAGGVIARSAQRDEAISGTNSRKRRKAFWRNEPEVLAQHFFAPAAMIAAANQEEFDGSRNRRPQGHRLRL